MKTVTNEYDAMGMKVIMIVVVVVAVVMQRLVII